MKRRNREINIFSMSALDLFASALGAFILIAIVIFPYFPNTSRLPVVPPPVPVPPVPRDADLQRQLDEIQSQLADARSRLAEAQEAAGELDEVRERLADVEDALAASQEQLADAEAGVQDVEQLRNRLTDAAEQLARAEDRENRLQEALEGERRRRFLLVTISWDRDDDVDLHVVDPRRNEYYYAARRHSGSPAQFEEDTVDGPGNEVWLHPRVEPGEYAIRYNLFTKRSREVEVRGSAVHSHGREELPLTRLTTEGDRRLVATVVVGREGNVEVR